MGLLLRRKRTWLVEGGAYAPGHVLGKGIGNGGCAICLDLVYRVDAGIVPDFHEKLLGCVQRDQKTLVRIIDDEPPLLDDVIQFFGIGQDVELWKGKHAVQGGFKRLSCSSATLNWYKCTTIENS